MRTFLITTAFLIFSIPLYALNIGDKARDNCNFTVIDMASNTDNCTEYYKYSFKDKNIYKAYDEFGRYFVPAHKYAVYWKRYLPFEREKYVVNKELVDNKYVLIAYDVKPKVKSIREGKRVNIEFVVDKERYFFELREVQGGTEISSCYSVTK